MLTIRKCAMIDIILEERIGARHKFSMVRQLSYVECRMPGSQEPGRAYTQDLFTTTRYIHGVVVGTKFSPNLAEGISRRNGCGIILSMFCQETVRGGSKMRKLPVYN